jgi:hypothetical protein
MRSSSASCTLLFTPSTSQAFVGLRRRHRHALADRQADDVGQVILALRVVVAQRRQPALERRGRRGHEAGVDLAMARSSSLASRSSTMRRTRPSASRTMRP